MKKTLLAMLLVCALVLTGCNLVVKDPEVDARQVVLNINGTTIDKQTLTGLYNGLLNQEYQMQQMYQMYGMQAPPIDFDKVMQNAKDMAIRQELIAQHAKAQGLDALTEEEEQQVNEKVDTEWASALEWVKNNYLKDTELEGDALTEALEHQAEDLGITRDATRDGVLRQFISDKLEQHTTKDVEVTDEETRADYDERVEKDKTAYAESPDTYGTTVNGGGEAYYVPAGYRYVKQVLVKFQEEDQKAIDQLSKDKTEAETALQTAEQALKVNQDALAAEDIKEEEKTTLEAAAPQLKSDVETAQAKVDELARELLAARNKGYEAILSRAQEVFNRAKTEAFDALVKEFNEDAGMPTTGYAVREGFANFDEAFLKPAMALQNVGDVAEPSQGIYGYYVVQYAADIAEGPVAYESVSEKLHDRLLTEKKNSTWEEALTKWREEGDIQEFMDRMAD